MALRLGRAFLVRLQASLRLPLPVLMRQLGRLLWARPRTLLVCNTVPTFWGEPVSAFHGRMGYSANMWLHHFEGLRPEDQPPEIRDKAFWVRKFPLNDSAGVALSDLVGDLESVQVLRFISGADPDPRSASASASNASPAAPQLAVDSSPDAFPEPVQTMVWRCRGLCMDCKKACCGKSDEEYDKVKWHKNHRCNYCWTVWKAEHR